MPLQHSIVIETENADKLNIAKNIVAQTFQDQVGMASMSKMIDSPNKDEIGKLGAAFKVEGASLKEGEHPLDFGTEVIGHLRCVGIPCHRDSEISGILENKDVFQDIIVLD